MNFSKFILPIGLIMACLFYQPAIGQNTNTTQTKLDPELYTPPVYQGCKQTKNAKKDKKCFSRKLNKYLTSHFDLHLLPKDIKKWEFELNILVDNEGKMRLVDILPEINPVKDEFIRLLAEAPTAQPSTYDGIPSQTTYKVPVVFKPQKQRVSEMPNQQESSFK